MKNNYRKADFSGLLIIAKFYLILVSREIGKGSCRAEKTEYAFSQNVFYFGYIKYRNISPGSDPEQGVDKVLPNCQICRMHCLYEVFLSCLPFG